MLLFESAAFLLQLAERRAEVTIADVLKYGLAAVRDMTKAVCCFTDFSRKVHFACNQRFMFDQNFQSARASHKCKLRTAFDSECLIEQRFVIEG